MGRFYLADPFEVCKLGTVDEARIVDFEARRQQVLDEDARRPVIRLRDRQHHDITLVLPGLGDIRRLSVHGVVTAIDGKAIAAGRSEEHTSELQSLMRISYAVFCLKQKTTTPN